MLASHVLMSLRVPPATVMRSVAELRGNRYEMLRNVIARGDGMTNDAEFAEAVRSVVLPPGRGASANAWTKCAARVRTWRSPAFRRQGILGREPTATRSSRMATSW
jgi:hypothetical protein